MSKSQGTPKPDISKLQSWSELVKKAPTFLEAKQKDNHDKEGKEENNCLEEECVRKLSERYSILEEFFVVQCKTCERQINATFFELHTDEKCAKFKSRPPIFVPKNGKKTTHGKKTNHPTKIQNHVQINAVNHLKDTGLQNGRWDQESCASRSGGFVPAKKGSKKKKTTVPVNDLSIEPHLPDETIATPVNNLLDTGQSEIYLTEVTEEVVTPEVWCFAWEPDLSNFETLAKVIKNKEKDAGRINGSVEKTHLNGCSLSFKWTQVDFKWWKRKMDNQRAPKTIKVKREKKKLPEEGTVGQSDNLSITLTPPLSTNNNEKQKRDDVPISFDVCEELSNTLTKINLYSEHDSSNVPLQYRDFRGKEVEFVPYVKPKTTFLSSHDVKHANSNRIPSSPESADMSMSDSHFSILSSHTSKDITTALNADDTLFPTSSAIQKEFKAGTKAAPPVIEEVDLDSFLQEMIAAPPSIFNAKINKSPEVHSSWSNAKPVKRKKVSNRPRKKSKKYYSYSNVSSTSSESASSTDEESSSFGIAAGACQADHSTSERIQLLLYSDESGGPSKLLSDSENYESVKPSTSVEQVDKDQDLAS